MNGELADKKMDSGLVIRCLRRAERAILQLSKVLHYAGGTILGLLILFITIDVVGRYVLNRPMKGDFELVVLAAGIIGSFSLAYTLVLDGHIRIDIATSHLRQEGRRYLNLMAYLFGLIFWVLATWRSVIYGITVKKSNLVSGMLPIPVYPFVFIVAFGCAVLCLVFLIKLVHVSKKGVNR
jgi:TRAP-type C4-dicarboxylate transport system permease small subunit